MSEPTHSGQTFRATLDVDVWFDAASFEQARDLAGNAAENLQVAMPGLVDWSVPEWRVARTKTTNVFDALLQVVVILDAEDEQQARQVVAVGPEVGFPGMLSSSSEMVDLSPLVERHEG
jgi:hypothetical protein